MTNPNLIAAIVLAVVLAVGISVVTMLSQTKVEAKVEQPAINQTRIVYQGENFIIVEVNKMQAYDTVDQLITVGYRTCGEISAPNSHPFGVALIMMTNSSKGVC